MQAERINYPYVEGERGIPLDLIMEKYRRVGKFSNRLRGGSGLELLVRLDSDFVEVRGGFGRSMAAYITSDDIAYFVLHTRGYSQDRNGDSLGEPHPDMFAAQFVKIAISFFRENGIDVKACQGMWSLPSWNREILIRGLEEHGDPVKAAKETWSGRQFVSLGFTELKEEDIETERTERFDVPVRAVFRKPS